MNCLLAILLFMKGRGHSNGRLVVMELGEHAELYHTYRLKEINRFRSVTDHADILMAPSKIEHEGTYLTIYCSASRSVQSLEEFVTEGALKLNRHSTIGFHQDSNREEECLDALQHGHKRLQKNNRLSTQIEIDALPLIRNGQCTASSIYCLALQGEISLHAKGNIDIKPEGKVTILVAYYDRFHMDSIVLGGQFLHVMRVNQKDFGLAWYQGHLKIFVKQPFTNEWMLKKEGRNIPIHHLINGIVAHKFPGVAAIAQALQISKQVNMRTAGHNQDPAQIQKFSELLTEIGEGVTKFTPVQANGFFTAAPMTRT